MAMKTMCLILSLVACSMGSIAEAANWQYVTSATVNGAFDMYVDVESLEIRGDIREFWDKSVYKEEQERDGQKFIENWVYGRINCSEKTRTYITVIGYDRNGERVFRYDVSPEMIPISPGSIGELVMKFVCGPPK